MIKFVKAETWTDVVERFGVDWYKIVKVDGCWVLFNDRKEYEAWKKKTKGGQNGN